MITHTQSTSFAAEARQFNLNNLEGDGALGGT